MRIPRRRWRWLAGVLAALMLLSPALAIRHDDVQYLPPTGDAYDAGSDSSDGGRPHYPDDGGDDDWKVPAIVAGAVALGLVGRWLYQRSQSHSPSSDDAMMSRLQRQGPVFAPTYNTSAFAAIAAVRGDWPFVLSFSHHTPVMVTLRLSARDVPEIYTLRLPFGPGDVGQHRLQFRLPPAFGDSERPAAIGVTATDMSGQRPAPDFRLLALGCGPRAIGSVAIEEVSFLPRRIRAQARERASYRFFSHSRFPRAVAEFIRVEDATDGERQFFVDEAPIDGGLAAGRSIAPRQWDGRDSFRRVSSGPHRLKVRAWAPTGGWVTAWSGSRVNVMP
ncbi:hypothetical protein [Halomonas maura]|uniref:hypothetical protein n=1 Tax=Halomonas maura TaxID=117606 RepID=UPI0025B596A6|nr:hypothetical protein [Halomonas maura]MDN3557402.1 hypothetical protein [Halomonas maura]